MTEEAKKTVPPCGKCTGTIPSTAVAKIVSNPVTMTWASTLVNLKKVRSVAVVCIQGFDEQCEQYLVITPMKITQFVNYKSQLQRQLEEFEAKVEWIRPLDRRLQRLLKWGDAWVDKEQILEADNSELAVLFPALRNIIAVDDAETTLIAAEHMMKSPPGAPLLMICDDHELSKKTLRAEHELTGEHHWSEPGKHWECSICQKFSSCRCVCGAQRCKEHRSLFCDRPQAYAGCRQG